MLQRKLSTESLEESSVKTFRQFNIRKITDKKDLIEHFSLRYEIYLKTGFIEENSCRLDVDFWDFRSDFFGIFDSGGNKMFGTIRCISPYICENGASEFVQDIIDEYSIKVPLYETESWFPMMQAFNLDDFLAGMKENKKKVFELGRLTINSQFMGNSLGIHLGDYAIRDFKKNRANVCIIAVHPRHSILYRKFGFEVIPGTSEVVYPGINRAAVAMYVDLNFYKNNLVRGNTQNDERRDPVEV